MLGLSYSGSFLYVADKISATARPVTTENKIVSPIFIAAVVAEKKFKLIRSACPGRTLPQSGAHRCQWT